MTVWIYLLYHLEFNEMSMKFHQGDPINRELFVSVYHKVCHMTQITGPLVGGKVVVSQRYSTNDWPNIYEKGDAKNIDGALYVRTRVQIGLLFCREILRIERSRGPGSANTRESAFKRQLASEWY